MAGSDFSTVNALDGVTKVPISSPAKDAAGNTVVMHLDATLVAGVSVPVSAAAPKPVIEAPRSGPLLDASGPVGVSATALLGAAVAPRQVIDLQNTGAVAVGVNFGATPSLGMGSIVLQPGGSLRYAAPGFVPSDPINAIANAAGGFVTLKWA